MLRLLREIYWQKSIREYKVVKGFLQLMQEKEQGKNYDYLSLVLSELGRAESIINDYFHNPKANRPSCIYLYCRYREGNES